MGLDVRMYVVFPNAINRDDLRRLSWRLGDAFHHSSFCPDLSSDEGWVGALSPMFGCDAVVENGSLPSLPGIPLSHIAEVQTLARYYGPDYARGSWHDFYAWRNWLVANIPGCRVYYGSDSDGHLDEMTDSWCANMQDYFHAHGHTEYHRAANSALKCPSCGGGYLSDYGGYGAVTYYRCDGCGAKYEYDGITSILTSKGNHP